MVGPRAALVVGILFAVNLSVFAQDRAILYPGAGVELNGKTALTTSAVSTGDTITTAVAAAQLVEKGATVQIQPGTSVKYGDSIVLECGGVSINGNTVVHVNNDSIVPAGPAARFDVVNRDGKLLVTVQSGAVSVGGETLGTGRTATRPGTAGCTSAAPTTAKATGGSKGKAAIGAAVGAGAVGGSCLAWWCGDKHKDDISHANR